MVLFISGDAELQALKKALDVFCNSSAASDEKEYAEKIFVRIEIYEEKSRRKNSDGNADRA